MKLSETHRLLYSPSAILKWEDLVKFPDGSSLPVWSQSPECHSEEVTSVKQHPSWCMSIDEEIDDGLLPERTHSCHFKQWELTVKTLFLSMTCLVKRWPQRWFISQSGESLNRRNFPQISQLTKSKVRLWALSVDFALIIYFCWSASSGRFVLVLFLV